MQSTGWSHYPELLPTFRIKFLGHFIYLPSHKVLVGLSSLEE